MSTAQSAYPSDRRCIRHLVLMGVAGCGKSSVGEALSRRSGLGYVDGDHLHPAGNVRKMRGGEALTDVDRWPWLDRCGMALLEAPNGLIGASALRRRYRDRLREVSGLGDLLFVHLDGDADLLRRRMAGRKGHVMPPTLLRSQLEALEPPGGDETALRVAIHQPIERVVDAILSALVGSRNRLARAPRPQKIYRVVMAPPIRGDIR
jgi:gluconokinase